MYKVYLKNLGSYRYPHGVIDWDKVYNDLGVDRSTCDVYDEQKFMISVLKYGISYIVVSLEEYNYNKKKELEAKKAKDLQESAD